VFAPTREESRRFLAEAWAKHRAGLTLTALERRVVDIVALHPEYHALLDDREHPLDRDYAPEGGAMNPFLHLSLHLAVAEQLGIDQPPGIRAEYARLRGVHGDEHDALHDVLECLGEVLWQAQRAGTGPDAGLYLTLLKSMPKGRGQ
jgi:hypothetical protein